MIDAQKRSDLQARFEDTFAPYGERAPAPAADESPASFHKHLLRTVQKKLSPSDDRKLSETSSMTVGDFARIPMNRSVGEGFDPLFHEVGALQAETPLVSTLPPAGEFVERHRRHDRGRKKFSR
jgi:hypothetical protein